MSDVTLRQVTDSLIDAMRIVRWRNENAEWFPVQEPWTEEQQLRWFYEVYQHDPSQNLYFVCVLKEPVGIVGMTIKRGSGELERMILGDKAYARKGYMRRGMRMLMDAYGLEHYWLRVMPNNEATINFHKRNGFRITTTEGSEYTDIHGNKGQYTLMHRNHVDGYWPVISV